MAALQSPFAFTGKRLYENPFRALPLWIKPGVRYPISIIFDDTNERICGRLDTEARCPKARRKGWRLVVWISAQVDGQGYNLDLQSTGSTLEVPLKPGSDDNGKAYFSTSTKLATLGQVTVKDKVLQTDITFFAKPKGFARRKKDRPQLFMHLSMFRDGALLSTTFAVPLHFFSQDHIVMREAVVDGLLWERRRIVIGVRKPKPCLYASYTFTIEYRIICFDPEEVFEIGNKISFPYNPQTKQIVGEVKVVS